MRLAKVPPNDWTVVEHNFNLVSKMLNQFLSTDSSPTFDGLTISSLTISDLTVSRLISTDASKALASTNLSSWVAGTANQISVANDGDGTITLSTPQNIHTAASPTFAGLTLSGLTAGRIPVVTTGGLLADSEYLLWDNTYGELHLKSTTAIYFGEDSESYIYHNGYYMRIVDDDSIHLDATAVVASGTVGAGTLTIGSGSITDSSGAISFGNENLTTTGSITAASGTFTGLTDGTATLTGGNLTGMGNITGTDVDISAGTGDYVTTGNMAVGSSILSTDKIRVYQSVSNPNAIYTGLSIEQYLQGAASGTVRGWGLSFDTYHQVTSGNVADCRGIIGYAWHKSARSISRMTGGQFAVVTSTGGTGTVTDFDGLHSIVSCDVATSITKASGLYTQLNIGAGTIALCAGVYVPTATKSTGSATNLFAFYDNGQTVGTNNWGLGINTTNNYINGNLRVGSAVAPVNALDITGASTFGDGGTTNYTTISAIGNVTFAGAAGLYPRVLSQADEPAAGTGATQLDTGELCMWIDSDDSTLWLCYNQAGTIKTVELS
jgi:hypothetical protein